MTRAVNVLLHGFGSAPIIFRYFLEISRQQRPDIQWHIILPSSTHLDIIREVVPKENILSIEDSLPNPPQGCDMAELTNYPGSLIEDLEAQKHPWLKRDGRKFYKRGQDYYTLYKSYMLEKQITHFLCIMVETPETKIAMATAHELGIDTSYCAHLRTMTGSVFATNVYEQLPVYQSVTSDTLAKAKQFVSDFRISHLSPTALPSDIDKSETSNELLDDFMPSAFSRLKVKLSSARKRLDLAEPDSIRVSFLNNLPLLRDAYWRFQASCNNKLVDIADINDLPEKFVLYPLQVSPESSINVPAPYYVDQLRVIDALRMAMPNDYTLIVKEHRAGALTRSPRFTRAVRNLPGVKIASCELHPREILRKSSLLATVTGTMGFEAFILGLPTIVFGRGICADLHGGTVGLNGLDVVIRERLNTQIPDEHIYQELAKYYSCRYPFVAYSTGTEGEPVLRRGNIEAFFAAYMDHLNRIDAWKTSLE